MQKKADLVPITPKSLILLDFFISFFPVDRFIRVILTIITETRSTQMFKKIFLKMFPCKRNKTVQSSKTCKHFRPNLLTIPYNWKIPTYSRSFQQDTLEIYPMSKVETRFDTKIAPAVANQFLSKKVMLKLQKLITAIKSNKSLVLEELAKDNPKYAKQDIKVAEEIIEHYSKVLDWVIQNNKKQFVLCST